MNTISFTELNSTVTMSFEVLTYNSPLPVETLVRCTRAYSFRPRNYKSINHVYYENTIRRMARLYDLTETVVRKIWRCKTAGMLALFLKGRLPKRVQEKTNIFDSIERRLNAVGMCEAVDVAFLLPVRSLSEQIILANVAQDPFLADYMHIQSP